VTRFFTHTDETDQQLHTLVETALGLMAGVLRPLGGALTRLPAGQAYPGRTAGPAFEMYYHLASARSRLCATARPRPSPRRPTRPRRFPRSWPSTCLRSCGPPETRPGRSRCRPTNQLP